MKLLKQLAAWLGVIFAGVLAAWLTGVLGQFLPPPPRVWLGLTNSFETKPPRPTEGFRFVLCWLEDDTSGRDTKIVEQAFAGIKGVELVRSARIVKASGAADEWRPAMRDGAREVLDEWNADLAVVGLVKGSGKTLSLWFVPREGDGTLRRADRPYKLENVALQKEFHEDLRAQLAAEALKAVAPLADTEVRGQVLEGGLTAVTGKLAILLEGDTITKPERRAALSLAYGTALATLVKRESRPERLEEAVAAYTKALKEYTRERVPLGWAATQHNLGTALATLGERESGPERLEQAVHAYTEALKEYTRERVPLQWAATQNNLGAALATLSSRESGPERLEQAVAAYTEALKEYTRERVPLGWAATQNNLGNALQTLGERESRPERLEEAVAAYTEALKEYTRERVPLGWAATQNNLGNALATLGKRESRPERLEEAVAAYTEALKERTRERVPFDWAMTQYNLGNALAALGERGSGPKRLKEAVAAYTEALKEYTRERVPFYWATTQHNLGNARATLGERENGPERQQAVAASLIETVMKLLKQLAAWLGVIFAGVLAAWLTGVLGQFLPPPRVWLGLTNSWLGLTNSFKTKPPRPTEGFRFVLCRLEDDTSGRDTKIVEQAFTDIKGVELVRSARIVKASGAADEWRPAMRKGARKVLDEWNADLAVVGLVKESGKALSLWFVPREGDGMLTRADQSYKLEDVALQKEFHEDLRAQLAAEALKAVAPLADTEVRGQVLEGGLTAVTGKLAVLLEGDTITKPERRAALSLAYGTALATLVKRESRPERLEEAVAAYTEALKEYTRKRVPLGWAATQHNLGTALATLGERESGPERLKDAVAAYTKALKEYTRERVPLDWAATQHNLGNALATLGKRESRPERLEDAVAAYTKALKEYTRERVPLGWAATQHNLGNALRTLGERESGPERLKEAVAAYTEALKERTRERVPLDWTATQYSLGNALATLGERE